MNMDFGQVLFIYSRLILGAFAAFFATIVWSKTRDIALMLMSIGIITAYIEIIYSILELLGITTGYVFTIGSISLVTILLPSVSMAFFIIAFLVIIIRQR